MAEDLFPSMCNGATSSRFRRAPVPLLFPSGYFTTPQWLPSNYATPWFSLLIYKHLPRVFIKNLTFSNISQRV